MFGRFKDWPHALEVAYGATLKLLRPFRRRIQPNGKVEKFFTVTERMTKGAIFDCQMCGDCVLHSTGMTCPMTCPKNLRNGPCGGVRSNGHCEVKPEMPCVWVKAWERSRRMPVYGDGIIAVLPPLDRSLAGTSAWVNEFGGREVKPPEGWDL